MEGLRLEGISEDTTLKVLTAREARAIDRVGGLVRLPRARVSLVVVPFASPHCLP